MTVEIKPDQIPEKYLQVLISAATKIIKKTRNGYAYCNVPINAVQSYVLWVGLNDKNVLEECYFLSDDLLINPITVRP